MHTQCFPSPLRRGEKQIKIPPLPALLSFSSRSPPSPTSWSVHAQFGIGMSAILILGIGRIPSLPSPFYMAARGPANEKVVPPWRCRNGTTCLDATAVSGIAEEEAVLYWVHAFLPLCSTILPHYSEEETLSLFPAHLAFYWFPQRCHLIGCQDNKEGRGEDKTEEVTVLGGREEEETCFSLSLSTPPRSFLPLSQSFPLPPPSSSETKATDKPPPPACQGGRRGRGHLPPPPSSSSFPSLQREKSSLGGGDGRKRGKGRRAWMLSPPFSFLLALLPQPSPLFSRHKILLGGGGQP